MREVTQEAVGGGALLAQIDRIARARLGESDATGGALAERVARLSALYTRERGAIAEEAASPELLCARLRFQLPRDLPKVQGPLEELRRAGCLPGRARWRVLDLGAGLGAASLGTALFARRTGAASALELVAVDRDRLALGILSDLAAAGTDAGMVPVSVRVDVRDLAREGVPAEGTFDLVLFGLSLNELAAAGVGAVTDLLARAGDRLAEDGSLVVIEPALRTTTRFLHQVRDALVARGGALGVFAPCLRAGACPMLQGERDWCHEELDLALPAPLAALAREAGLRGERPTYSYLVLRRDGRRLGDAFEPGAGALYRAVSAPLVSKGKVELFGCGAQGRARFALLDRERTAQTEALVRARRGAVLRVEGAAHAERVRLRPGAAVSILWPEPDPTDR